MGLNVVSDEVLSDIFSAAVAEPPRELSKVTVKIMATPSSAFVVFSDGTSHKSCPRRS